MKSSTKGFLIGLVAGAALLFCLEVAGMVALGLVVSSRMGTEWMAERMLRAPEFPEIDTVEESGRTDYDWALRTADGETVPFSDFRGKTVFLNVWATWCPPCVMEMPSIERLRASTDPSKVAFVLVSKESDEVVRAFVESEKHDLPLYVTDDLPELFASDTIPMTFVVDPEGAVVFRHSGAMKWDTPATVNFLHGLGGGSSAATSSNAVAPNFR